MQSSSQSLRLLTPFLLALSAATAQTTITVNPATTYQTMTGWEVLDVFPVGPPDLPSTLTTATIDKLLDKTANEAGIDRVRLEVRSGAETNVDYYAQSLSGAISNAQYRCRRYATVNDNNDPNVLNMAGFKFTELDERIETGVLKLRQKLQARGEKLHINLTYVAFVNHMTEPGCPAGLGYVHDDSPEEYAEFMLAVFTHMKGKYGFVPDTIEVILEPDNTPFWRGMSIGQAILATAKRLGANGFNPKFIGPSNTSMQNALYYFNDLVAYAPQALPYMSEISYHRYSGVTDSALTGLANAAKQHNLSTSMLEWWDTGNGYKILHKDLKVGNNSSWEQVAIVGPVGDYLSLFNIDNANPANPIITPGPMAKYTRHYTQFVRKGAVRVGATSSSTSNDPIAFRNKDGKFVVVTIANASGSIAINGLAAGTYGVKYTSLSNSSLYHIDAPDVTVSSGQTLNTSIPYAALVTVYSKTAGGSGQISPCDLNSDSRVDSSDVQLGIDQTLGKSTCSSGDLSGDGKCNVVDVQRIINAALNGTCRTGS